MMTANKTPRTCAGTPTNPNTRLLAPLSLLFLLPALAFSKLYKEYDGSFASVDPGTWDLLDAGCCRDVSLKPSLDDLLPSVSAASPAPYVSVDTSDDGNTSRSKVLRVGIGADAPADASGLQKVHYLVMSGNNFDAPQASTVRSNTGYSGLAFKFDAQYEVAPAVGGVFGDAHVHLAQDRNRGTQLWQAWQGSGWPPVQLRTDETDGSIRLYLLLSTDECRGSYRAGCTRVEYLKDIVTDEPIVFATDVWYRIVIATRADYTSTEAGGGGYVAAWVDNGEAPAAEHSGTVGYRPESEGGQAGTLDGLSISFGLYRHRSDANVNQAVHFDGIKYTQTKEEALPFYTDKDLAAMPSLDAIEGGGYCSSNYELKDNRGRSLRVESPYMCLKATEAEPECVSPPDNISFGIGARAGRCRCDKVAVCSAINGKSLGEDGFDRLSVIWPPLP